MISISIAVCGDDWANQAAVVEQLKTIDSDDPVVLDLHAEGPSLHALGIVDTVQLYVPADRVYIKNWSNAAEQVPFQRLNQTLLSHFFWYSDRYKHAVPQIRTAEYLLAYFVGRRTVPRCVMLKDIQQQYSTRCLLSLMNTVANFKKSSLDPVSDWCDPDKFDLWWNALNINSVDGHTVRDQFNDQHNTNASLLRWYSQFDVELVAETYCHGNTFFITEKTVRPIVAGKSMLIYGPQNYLKRLRDLGFCTWSTVWDESYDQLAGPDRWKSIKSVIDDIAARDQEQLYQQCLPIVQHNRAHAEILTNRYRPG